MKQHTLYVVLVILSLQTINQSQAQFNVDAQLRNRFEFRDGYQKILPNKSTPAFLITQRSRLSFSYNTEKIKLKFTPQDVRIWGDEELASSTGVFGDKASLDLFESFVEIRAGSTTWFSVGRQQLVYDNQRLLATRNWNQLGISYDALLIKFQISKWKLHIAGSWNTLIESSSENYYNSARIKTLNFLWINHKLSEDLNFSLLHVGSGVTQSDTTNRINFRQTTGLYFNLVKNKLNVWGDVYYQYGKNQAGVQVSAFLAGADASYKLDRFTPGIGFEYLSGNRNTAGNSSTDHLFDILYGARHRYFGFMDYFRNIPLDTKEGGLVDYYYYFDFRITKLISLQNAGHYFLLAQTNQDTPEDKKLGYENDIVIKYKFNDWGVLEGGYLFLLPTESLKKIQHVTTNNFAQFSYIQLTITPTLFNQQNHH